MCLSKYIKKASKKMMTTNLTKRINESICAVGIPVLRRHRAQVTKRPWKRALSSASLCASLTIEAALSLTLFMFTVILLSVPMEILDTQRKVQTVLEERRQKIGNLKQMHVSDHNT